MKTLKLIILCVGIFLNNSIIAQQFYHTDYDTTIDKLIPKAKKNKLNEKQINLLATSYHQANQDDHKRIMELKESGQADIWIEIYFRISNISKRQDKISALPNNIKNSISFRELNLDNEIRASQEKAELYICAKTNLLLQNPTDDKVAEAKSLVDNLCIINPQSNNIDKLRLKLAIIPSEHILFRIATPTDLHLPDNFAQLALNFDKNTMFGIPFDIVPNSNSDYDLMIRIMINEKIISPERIDAVTFEERKDNHTVKVTDKTKVKSATIKGNIEIIDVKKDKIILNTPFNIGSTFTFHYAEIQGNKAACSEKTLELLSKQPIDFPSDEALLKDTARKLNLIIKSHYQE